MRGNTHYMNNTLSGTDAIFAKQEKNTRKFSFRKETLYFFPLVFQTLIWIPTRFVFKFFLHFKIRGVENLHGIKKPVIFAVNHSSEWDPVLVPAALPFLSRLMPVFYTSRERGFYNKNGIQSLLYGGLFFKIWGAYPVKVGMKNYERSLRQHIDILESVAGSICFFPEGAKTRDGNLLPAKGGISYLAHRTKATIVPVAIHGHFGMRKTDFFLRKKKVTVTFGEAIPPQDLFEERYYSPHDHKEIAQKVMQKIQRFL